mmetsp:Transcript_139053/g.444055  ORF Transcript_139053/g.444055 Transcript_139053/m.444055 type:complete len:364 (+) Transcript_139053:4021-5112(+)
MHHDALTAAHRAVAVQDEAVARRRHRGRCLDHAFLHAHVPTRCRRSQVHHVARLKRHTLGVRSNHADGPHLPVDHQHLLGAGRGVSGEAEVMGAHGDDVRRRPHQLPDVGGADLPWLAALPLAADLAVPRPDQAGKGARVGAMRGEPGGAVRRQVGVADLSSLHHLRDQAVAKAAIPETTAGLVAAMHGHKSLLRAVAARDAHSAVGGEDVLGPVPAARGVEAASRCPHEKGVLPRFQHEIGGLHLQAPHPRHLRETLALPALSHGGHAHGTRADPNAALLQGAGVEVGPEAADHDALADRHLEKVALDAAATTELSLQNGGASSHNLQGPPDVRGEALRDHQPQPCPICVPGPGRVDRHLQG